MSDDPFVEEVGGRLAALPGVRDVALGGSRAQGAERPDSDWDFAVYYRDRFDPQDLRDLGWPGEISEIGGWGGGVFNGGARLEVEGRRVDVHYRDLDVVEREMREAAAGRFRIEPLLFHLAGIPSYLLVAELALNRVVRGQLPRPAYPDALREHALRVWRRRSDRLFAYARDNYARRGQVAQSAGLVAEAASCAAHAILADRGEWITNEKALLARAGLGGLDGLVADLDPGRLDRFVEAARRICSIS